jgi:CO/xanthine dehydrogenase Mo-binding subunit
LSSNVTRRAFLKTSVTTGASLLLPFYLSGSPRKTKNSGPSAAAPFAPNAWLELSSDGGARIWCGKSEMGQGVRTALPMIVAEELCCDWRRVQVVQADLDPKYGEQLTGGSGSVRTSYENLRKAGAAAREMLLSAAAIEWNVPHASCHAENGSVIHAGTARTLAYPQLFAAAANLQPPADPPLKKLPEFRLIGVSARRTDTPQKINGTARFGIDVRVPGMLAASVERCPVYGGAIRNYNGEKVRLAIHPLGVEAQMEGAIHFGLAAALKSAITVSRGRVEQSNFHDYEVLRMNDAPAVIDVHIVPSTEPPGGCGEPGVPPIAAALGNAIFAATGRRIRRLPIRAADLRAP